MTTTTYGSLSASEHDAQLRKAIVASTIGTAIEWYDFFLYGTAAGLIFGKLFFPIPILSPQPSLPSVPISLVLSDDLSALQFSATTAIASGEKQRSSRHFC